MRIISPPLPNLLGGPLLLLLAVALAGCGGSGQNSDSGSRNATGPAAADNVLRDMIRAYARAESYSDEALIRVKYRLDGQPGEESSTQSVGFKRPNQMALRVRHEQYTADVVCDGTTLVAQVKEPLSLDMGKQVVVLPAPQRFHLRDIQADGLLFDNYVSVLDIAPIQLELLVESKPLSWAFSEQATRKMLADAALDGRPCYRVQVDSAAEPPKQGRHVFWIDKQTHLLRRLDYPPHDFPAEFENAELFVDFRKASFNPLLNDQDFRFEIPTGAVQVRFFVPPPASPPIALDLYGARPDFTLVDAAAGTEITRESLAGKYVVLAWFDDTAGSRELIRQLDAFHAARKDDDSLKLYAVGVKTYQGADPAELLRDWESSLPLLLDAKLHQTLGIKGVPGLVVLDATGAIQYSELGVNPASVSASLAAVLDRLKGGENVAETERNQLQLAMNRYDEALQTAQGESPSAVIEVPDVEILPAQDPQRLKLTPAWTNGDLAEPGNILPIDTPAGPRLLVLDGWRTVVELDEQGKTVARHELPLKPNAAVSYLRSAVDKEGKRWYAASFRMGTHVYLFDENWRLVFSYPQQEESRISVRDVQLADLGDDGQPELLVGFWGQAGVHSVSLAGKRSEWNRIYPDVFSLAVSAPNPNTGWRKLLATGSEGGVLELNQFLRHDSPYKIENPDLRQNRERQMQSIFAAGYHGGDIRFCGIAETPEGATIALGLAEGPYNRLEEVWSYELPRGVMTQVESAASGRLIEGPGGQWLFAAADGSLHVVSQDAKFNDYWTLGKLISGMAIAHINDRPAILLASEKEVAAWYVEALPAP